MHKVTCCRVTATDLLRIKRLAMRVRRGVGARRDIPRAALLRALVNQGLYLAETREIKGDPRTIERLLIIDYRIANADLNRLYRLQKRLEDRWPCSPKPTLSRLQQALIKMALSEAEIQASFPRFLRAVLTTLSLKRGEDAPFVGDDALSGVGDRH
jgi:hypothetical protein